MTQQGIDASAADVPSVFHVSVDEEGTIEVDGGTPTEVISLLQSSGNTVVLNGRLMPPPPDVTLESVDDLDELTQRELAVLQMIVGGLSNQDIADESYLSINTIKAYIRNTYRKIDVTSRTQAVVWAIDRGVVGSHHDRRADDEPA